MICSGWQNQELRSEKARRESALREVNRRVDEALQKVTNFYGSYSQEFEKKKKELTRSWQKLQNWDSEIRQARITLENKKRDIQLRDFLDKRLIAQAHIPNFGEKRKAALAAYGIESALDIRSDMRVPGIGTALQKDLMRWRSKCESAFRYNPNEPLPDYVLRDMQNQLANTRRDLEADIRSGPEQLKRLNQPIMWTIKEYERNIPELLRQKAQAQADFDLMNRH
jgi:DNA-binding helix-hairpin-helix protein with protein kinase domain